MGAKGAVTTALCLVDLWIAAGVLDGGLDPVRGLALHYAAVPVFAAALLSRGHAHRAEGVAWIALTLLFGPVAGPAMACLFLFVHTAPRGRAIRAGIAIAPETPARTLARRIREGRRHALTGTLPQDYATIFAGDDLDLQQRAMSAISRDWRPEMRPALHCALDSAIPAIRVQAAAIHAKLRGRYEGAMRDLSTDGAVRDAAAARRAVETARSGFVAPETAAALLRKADAVGAIAIPAPVVPDTGRSRRTAPPRLKRYACGGIG